MKEIRKWKCIEVDPHCFGVEEGGVYREDESRERIDILEKDEMFILNKRGNRQLVNKKYFEPID